MASPNDADIYEWMDLVDVVVSDKQFLNRIKEWFSQGPYISASGVVLVRPGWLNSELHSDSAEHNDAASRIWTAWKRLERLKYETTEDVTTVDFWADYGPETRVRQKLYDRESEIWHLKRDYYNEAVDTDMSVETRTKYRTKLNNLHVKRNQAHQKVATRDARWSTTDGKNFEFNPSPTLTPEQEQRYKRNAVSAKRRKTTGSIFGFILKLLFYPIFLLFVINISGIYFGVFGILFVACLVISPFYWLAGDKDFNPVSVTKLALQGLWVFIGSITVGYWED